MLVFLQGKCLNLDDQIDLFEQTVKVDLPKHHQSKEKVSDYLSNSIFLVSLGSNDYISNYLQPSIYATSKRYSPHSFAQLLSNSLSYKFEVLSLSLEHAHTLLVSESIFHINLVCHLSLMSADVWKILGFGINLPN